VIRIVTGAVFGAGVGVGVAVLSAATGVFAAAGAAPAAAEAVGNTATGIAAIGAVGYTTGGIAVKSYAASVMAAEVVASGGGVAAGGFTATMQSVGAVGIVSSGWWLPVFAAGALVGVAVVGCWSSTIVGAEAAAAGGSAASSSIVLPIIITVAIVGVVVACAVKSSKARDYAQVGDYSSIANGNTVALHSECHNRFIRLFRGHADGGGGRKNIDKAPCQVGIGGVSRGASLQSRPSRFTVYHCRFMSMNEECTMTGLDVKVQEDDPGFDEHKFIVRDEGNGNISLLSCSHNSFVRMDDKGNVDGNAAAAKEWKLFQVMLLLENAHITK
jgi:hypothetical protein